MVPWAFDLVLRLAGHDVGGADVASLTRTTPDSLLLRLDGFEGPLDLLLDLARGQKVDLARISILSLVEQYLAVIEGARRVRLELAADWLVMAAWLTWLKSRLLLPEGSEAAEEGEAAAEVLAARLRDLQAMRAGAVWLAARPQLGQDVFARGAPEDLTEIDRSRLALDLPALLRAYLGGACGAAGSQRRYRPAPLTLWTRAGCAAAAAGAGGQPARLERAWSSSCRTRSAARWSAAPRWPARCWPGWKWRAAAALRLRQERAFRPDPGPARRRRAREPR